MGVARLQTVLNAGLVDLYKIIIRRFILLIIIIAVLDQGVNILGFSQDRRTLDVLTLHDHVDVLLLEKGSQPACQILASWLRPLF